MTLPAGELLAIAMLVTLAIALFSGLSVAVVLIAVGLAFGGLGVLAGVVRAPELGAIFFRIYGTLTESDDLAYAAVPVLIFMGAMLQSAGFAGDLLAALQRLAGRRRAALPVAVMAIGLLLAPLAGAIAASVSTLALLALPTLLERGYRPSAAGGVVAAAGTLGVIVPPSIMLFFIADSLGVQVPALFLGMLLPAALLFALYVACVLMAERSNRAALPGSHRPTRRRRARGPRSGGSPGRRSCSPAWSPRWPWDGARCRRPPRSAQPARRCSPRWTGA